MCILEKPAQCWLLCIYHKTLSYPSVPLLHLTPIAQPHFPPSLLSCSTATSPPPSPPAVLPSQAPSTRSHPAGPARRRRRRRRACARRLFPALGPCNPACRRRGRRARRGPWRRRSAGSAGRRLGGWCRIGGCAAGAEGGGGVSFFCSLFCSFWGGDGLGDLRHGSSEGGMGFGGKEGGVFFV